MVILLSCLIITFCLIGRGASNYDTIRPVNCDVPRQFGEHVDVPSHFDMDVDHNSQRKNDPDIKDKIGTPTDADSVC